MSYGEGRGAGCLGIAGIIVLAFAGIGVRSCFFAGPNHEQAKQERALSARGAPPSSAARTGDDAVVAVPSSVPDAVAVPTPKKGSHGEQADDGASVFLAESQIRDRLKDPGSVKFSHISVHTEPHGGSHIVCGLVNSRNGFGGYTGTERFMSNGTPEATFMEEQATPREFRKAWTELCVRTPVTLSMP